MTRRKLTTAIAGRSPDIGSRAVTATTGIAVRTVRADDLPPAAAGYPMPGWWVLLDGQEQALPVIGGLGAGIEPGLPVWVLTMGGAQVVLGGVSTARNDWPDWLDDPKVTPMHPWARVTLSADLSIPSQATPATVPNWYYQQRGWAWGAPPPARAGNSSYGDEMYSNLNVGAVPESGPQVLRVPFDGLWEATAVAYWAPSSTGNRLLRVQHARETDTTWTIDAQVTTVAAGTWATGQQVTSGPIPCQAGDLWAAAVAQNSGAALNLTAGFSWFSLTYVGTGPTPARSPDAGRQARVQTGFGTPPPA